MTLRDLHSFPTRRSSDLASAGTARAKLRGRPGADERATLVRVRLAEQQVERDVRELRIAIPRFAVGERELRALHNRVDELGARDPQLRDVEAFEQCELLQ